MTDRPSIESLRAALAHLDNQSCHGALSDEAYALLSAGISELESLRARPITGIGDGDIRAALAERDALRASEADLQRDHDALTSLHAGTESTLHALRAENKMLRANPRMLVHPDGRAERLESDQEAALRAENARLVAERDGLKEKCADLDAGWKTASELLEIQKTHLTAAESRADALAARVEVLCEALRNLRYNFGGANLMAAEHAADAVLNSTPAADLSALEAEVAEFQALKKSCLSRINVTEKGEAELFHDWWVTLHGKLPPESRPAAMRGWLGRSIVALLQESPLTADGGEEE